MLQGAEVILTPNACTLEGHRLGQFRARAFENMVGVAMANYAPPLANGHSVAYDCMIVEKGSGVYRDTLVVEAGGIEGVYLAPFDLDAIREFRANEVWGNAFRRPKSYAGLLADDVAAPFHRDAARREPV
jgi:predicted amidohydrolase